MSKILKFEPKPKPTPIGSAINVLSFSDGKMTLNGKPLNCGATCSDVIWIQIQEVKPQ